MMNMTSNTRTLNMNIIPYMITQMNMCNQMSNNMNRKTTENMNTIKAIATILIPSLQKTTKNMYKKNMTCTPSRINQK